MAQKHIAEFRREDSGEEAAGLHVVKVTVGSGDTGLEIHGIGPFAQHLLVIIGLDHNMLGLAHVIVNTRSYAAEVGGHCHGEAAAGDEIARVVRAVVTHLEGGKLETGHSEWEFLEDGTMEILDTPRDAVAAEHPRECLGGACPRICRQTSHGQSDHGSDTRP